MNQIITLHAEGDSLDSLISSAQAAAKSVADSMPQHHKDALARTLLAHYFFLKLAQDANPDTAAPTAEACFYTLTSIISDSGITITPKIINTTKN